MADTGLAPILSFVGWYFIPSWATSTLQTVYYKLTVPVGRTPPQPGTPLFAKHYRRIRILVLSLYLVYTLLQSLYDIKLAGDFFTWLTVTPVSTDREIKSKFRRLAAKYHPDKMQQPTFSPENPTASDNHFLSLKLAQDTLLNPTLRYAYTRFGPSIVKISIPSSLKPSINTYVFAGLKVNLLPTYLINIGTLTVLNYFFLPKWGTYWRYYFLTFIFTIELYFLTQSDPSFANLLPAQLSPILKSTDYIYALLISHTKLGHLLPPHLLPYQILEILRKLSISVNIFISQLAPPPSPASMNATGKGGNPNAMLLDTINQSLTHLNQAATRTDAESTALLSLQLTPYHGDPRGTEKLREGMREGVVRGALTAHEGVRDALRRAQARRSQSRRQGPS